VTLLEQLAEVLEAAARRARELAAEERAERRDWLDQRQSPLGPKRHCAAVKRLVAAGDPGAALVGRRHLLSAAALAQELGRASQPKGAKPEATGVRAQIEQELRLVRGG